VIRAWRLAGGALVETERPDPIAGDDEVIVAVEAFVLGPREATASGDWIAGGACVGTVSATGEAATHLLGARVLVGPLSPCGECDVCRRGNACVCPAGTTLGVSRPGTMAASVAASARWVCRIEAGLEVPGPAAALLPREAADAYAMYARAGVSPGEPVVIVGSGPMARFVADIARARGCKPTGADNADDTTKPRRIFETAGTAEARATAMAVANHGATVALCPSTSPAPVDVDRVIRLDVNVLGVAGAHPDLVPEVAAMAVKGEIDVAAAAMVVSVADDIASALAAAQRDGKGLVVRIA
jgi:6-hydroxycyclohex-1-ene-1-carbonyl-CoA dehydrogenase